MSIKLACGCTPDASGYGYCGECTRKLREQIWARMSRENRDYDRHFAPDQSKELDDHYNPDEEPSGCSCHINPPCGYCTRNIDNDDEIHN